MKTLKDKRLSELFVEVTNYCLQSCVHCSSCAGPTVCEYIPLPSIQRLIDETIPLGLESFTISGGEPLLYPWLADLMDYVHSKNVKLSLYTCGVMKDGNGYLSAISDDMIDVIVKRCPEKMIFSVQGGSSQIHEQVSGIAGSFALTLQSIEKAVKRGLEVELHFVPMTINALDIEKVVAIADYFAIKKVSILRLVPQGRVQDEIVLPPAAGLALKERVEELRQKYPQITLRLGAPFSCVNLTGNNCSAAQNKLLISATGEIYPCEAFKSLKGTRPKIYDHSIQEIWNHDALLQKIRLIPDMGVTNCTSCQMYSLCTGGCPGQRMLANGDILLGPDPWCKI